MASFSSTPPVGPSPQPTIGEGSGIPVVASTAPTKAVVDTPVVRSSAPGEASPVAPSSFFEEIGDPKEGFVFPLVDPWYESSSLFLPRSFDSSPPSKDWDWTVTGSEVAED